MEETRRAFCFFTFYVCLCLLRSENQEARWDVQNLIEHAMLSGDGLVVVWPRNPHPGMTSPLSWGQLPGLRGHRTSANEVHLHALSHSHSPRRHVWRRIRHAKAIWGNFQSFGEDTLSHQGAGLKKSSRPEKTQTCRLHMVGSLWAWARRSAPKTIREKTFSS